MLVAAAALAWVPSVGRAQTSSPTPSAVPTAAPSSYADVADRAVDAATIIDARIRSADEAPPERQAGIPAGLVRLYVEAEPNTLIYGRDPVARRIGYYVDQPRQANGRAPRLRGQRVLLFARAVTVANRIQLVDPGAQLGWTPGRDATARAIAAELATGAPPRVTGVAQAFHVPGSIAGESETQIFLRTASGDPVSLSILRRPGQAPAWAAAFGEIVDESAGRPAARTLGWYRLACGLPPVLPADSTATLAASDAAAAARDYAFARQSIGVCDRTAASPGQSPTR